MVAQAVLPTFPEAHSAFDSPDTGSWREGWGGLVVHNPLSPLDLPTATRGAAPRRVSWVVDYDQYLDEVWANDPVARLEAGVALTVRYGPETLNRYHAAFGFLPMAFRARDLESPVTYSPHGVIVLLGFFGGSATVPVETWSCSTSHDVVGPDVGAMPNTIGATALEDIYDAWATMLTSLSPGDFGSGIYLEGIAYYRRQADGTSTTGTWERYIAPSPAHGSTSSGGATKALQNALVVTEDAGGRRRGRFGRFYLPAPAEAPILGVQDAITAGAILTHCATALTTTNTVLNGVVGSDTELVVASGIGSGENRPVRSLRVGHVVDTQRRRRRSLDEAYTVQDFQTV